jgi:Mn2+/Fe2+ NRAMP family transporter
MINIKQLKGIIRNLGPGILFVCVTVGGANFIQATHAGAEYGLKFLPLIVLIYLLKYPFFEFAQRYGLTTQSTLLDGYLKIGRPALWLYIILIFCTAFPVIAALSLVNANIIAYFLDTTISPLVISIGLLSLFVIILFFGKYPWLDRSVKLVVGIMILCALITFFIALPEGLKVLKTPTADISYFKSFAFLVALMGWMPAPIDISVWTTLWSKAKARETNHWPRLKEGLIDFNIGYLVSALLALIFVALGAFVMFASSQTFAKSGVIFIEQLITLFTTQIGKSGEPFIAVIIFSVLLSATLICLDAYPRAFTNAITLLKPDQKDKVEIIYWVSLFLLGILLSGYFLRSMKQLIDLATTFAFLTAPIFGYLNYRVATSTEMMSAEAAPNRFLIFLSKIGLFFLISVSVLYIILHIFPFVFKDITFLPNIQTALKEFQF